MTAHDVPHAHSTDSTAAGSITLALGVLFTAAVAFAFPLSLSDTFNPPNWVRVVGLLWLPIGLGGVPIGYAIARTGPGLTRARVGALIALVGLVAFAALVVAVG